jgi:cytochrome b561
MIKSIVAKIKQNHLLAMVLCCAIPVVGILALSASGVLGSWAYFLMILLCPLGHIFMMRGMHSSHAEPVARPEVNEIEHNPQ